MSSSMTYDQALAFFREHGYVPAGFDEREFRDALPATHKLSSFGEITERSGTVAALNTWAGSYGYLPEQEFDGQYTEAEGLPDLDPDAEMMIRDLH